MSEVAGEKPRHAAKEMRVGIVRLQGDGAIVTGQCLVKPLQTMQRDATVDERFGMIRLPGNRLIITRQRFVKPPKLLQRDATIAERGRYRCRAAANGP